MGRICVARVWNREGTEKLVNGKQHSVWFVPTRINGPPQNVLLNFRLEFPKSDLTIYLPSGISEIFCQMVSTLWVRRYISHRPENRNAGKDSLRIVRGTKERIKLEPFRSFIYFLLFFRCRCECVSRLTTPKGGGEGEGRKGVCIGSLKVRFICNIFEKTIPFLLLLLLLFS